jgi:hypothetical protein
MYHSGFERVKFLAFLALQRNYFMYVLPNGLVFRECKHIKNIFEDVYFTKNSFHNTLKKNEIIRIKGLLK